MLIDRIVHAGAPLAHDRVRSSSLVSLLLWLSRWLSKPPVDQQGLPGVLQTIVCVCAAKGQSATVIASKAQSAAAVRALKRQESDLAPIVGMFPLAPIDST